MPLSVGLRLLNDRNSPVNHDPGVEVVRSGGGDHLKMDQTLPLRASLVVTMNRLRESLELHPVGHGLFASGSVRIDTGPSFDWVYDCGSLSNVRGPLKAEVARWRKDLNRSSFDLLVISHLDRDHVNGLPSLLRAATPRHVLLPYFFPAERLLIALTSRALSSWDQRFILDPARELFRLAPGAKVTFLIGGQDLRGSVAEVSPEGGDIRDAEGMEGELHVGFRENSFDRLPEVVAPLPPPPGMSGDPPAEGAHGPILRRADGPLNVGPFEFRFYVTPPDKRPLRRFERSVTRLFRAQSLTAVLADPKGTALLARLYRELAQTSPQLRAKINNTSLVTYHGATGRARTLYSAVVRRPSHPTRSPGLERFRGSWPDGYLHTGDISLAPHSTLSEVVRTFAPVIDRIGTLSAPHHGSSYNWNPGLMSALTAARVVTASVRSTDKRHPGSDVVRSVSVRGGVFVTATERYGVASQHVTLLKAP